uniref:Genome polyprotein n=1 Tax=Isahaya Culex iflavirus TaxID=2683676 RepID=A0A6F8PYP0_9VIRU|nr:RNA-dependent RNA polymerase [Isahaya Culex iflavirus]
MATTKDIIHAKGQSPTKFVVDAIHEFSKTKCLQIKLEKVREQYVALCRKWSFLPTTSIQRSFAEVAARSCEPQVFVPVTKKVVAAETATPKSIPFRHILSKREARQDFAAAGAERNAQRRANNELAAMIEARYAEKRPLLSLPHRISRKVAQASVVAFSRARQSEKKRNNYLAACIGFRYGVQYNEEEHAPVAVPLCGTGGSVERSIRGPCDAKKQVKEKLVVEEDWDYELSKIQELGKADFPGLRSSFLDAKYCNRRLNLRSVLLATSRGKALLCGIVARLFELRNLDTSFITQLGLDQCVRPREAIVPEMDTSPTVTSVKSDTVIDSSVVETAELQPLSGYYKESSTMLSQVYSTLTDRWLLISNFDWNSNQTFNTRIKTIDLPYSVIRDNSNASNANLFLQHRFFRSNIRVKILLNTNRYQVGALVASVFYYEKASTGNGQDNVVSGLQRLHHTIKAGGSDTCEFLIPYRHINSALSLKDKEEANFCKIEFYVLNQLSVAEVSAASCSLTVSICFEDSSFNGLIARAYPQMDIVSDVAQLALNPSISGAINVAASVLNTQNADSNRDNPPVPLQPMSFVPQAVGSFCHTDNTLEPINVLRADPTGQVPHPDTSNEMSTDQLRRTWGYLKTIRWTTEDKYSSQLDNFSVAPLLPINEYSLSVPTPLAMLTSMYGFWRGDIEFKFEVVANAFYQGKFMVTCVPLASPSAEPTMDQAKLSANQVYSVDTTEEKIFVCPWNWYNSFAKTRREEQMFDSIGLLQVFVYNRLIAIANVSPNIYINVYVRGGQSFEEAIIRPPLLYSSQVDPLLPPTTQSPTPYNTESAWYTTYNSSVKSASGNYPIVPYIQDVVGGWVGYTNLKLGYLYRLENRTSKNLMYRCIVVKKVDNKLLQVPIRYGTYDPGLSSANAHGMVVSDKKEDIVAYIQEYRKTKDVLKARDKLKTVWIQDGTWSQVLKNGQWVTATDVNDPPIWTWDGEVHEERSNLIIGEMRRAIRLGPPTKPTQSGRSIFGERCPDLKSYCRRYNTYGSMNIKACTEGLPQDCPYAAVMRVCPIRHILPKSSRSFDNRYREGPISSIGEMYRFWRGGLRFRFVVAGNPPEGTMMFVCHRFDLTSPSDLPVMSNKDGVVLSADDMLHTQYATYSQALSVNQVFTIEVPYYQEKEYLSLLNSSDRSLTDNGCLQIWVTSSAPANLHIEVYYSFADDTRYSLFQGVGVSKDISTIAPEPEMDVNIHSTTNVGKTLYEVHENPQMDIHGCIRGVKSFVGDAAQYFKGKYETLCETSKNLKDTLSSFNSVADSVKTVKAKVTSFWDYLMNLSSDMIDLLVSIFYAITARSFLHASLAIANIIRKCFISLRQNVISKLYDALTKVSDWVLSLKPTQVAVPEMDTDSEAIGALGSFVFSALSSLCSVTVSPPTSFAGLKKGLFDFSQTARSSSSVKTYLVDTVEFIRRCVKTFATKFAIKSSDYKLISGMEDTRLKNWLIDSSFITSSQNREAVLQKPEWALKAFELQLVGRALMVATAVDSSSNARLSAIINKVAKDLEELSVELRNKKVFAGVRYEPCVVWIASTAAGIGKSRYVLHLMERYAKELKIDSINYYYAMTPGMKHADGMENKPFIFADDAASLSMALDSFFYTFMLQGKSSGQYTPAFADLPLKGTILNFQNVFASSNKEDFSNSPGILSEDAFNRRLDIPIRFKPNAGWTINRVKTASKEELDRLDQLTAYFYDPLQKNVEYEIKREPNKSYRDTVDEHILQALCKYHIRESARYTAACEKVRERLQNASVQAGRSFEEQLEAYRKVVNSLSCSESDATPYKDKYVIPDLDAWLNDFKRAASFDLKQPLPVYSREQAQAEEERLIQQGLNEPSTSGISVPEFIAEETFYDVVPEMDAVGREAMCWHTYKNLQDMAYMDRFAVDMRTMDRYPKECPASVTCVMRHVSVSSRSITHKLCYNQYNLEETAKGLQNKQCAIPRDMIEMLEIGISSEPFVSTGLILDILAQEQKKVRDQHRIIADVVLPKQKKGWASYIWDAISFIISFVFRILAASLVILTTLAVIQGIARMFSSEEPPKAQLHPSGDYQTIKSSTSLRAKALRLVQPQMAQRESLKEVQDQFEEKLRIISGNTLFLQGTDPVTGAVYKGRCLGLYDRTVLTVKHYFDHFIHKNIKRLRIVRPNSNTTIYDVDIDDLRTRWGDCGYGILTLPKSYPTQFRKITQFFPTEGLASEYPAKIQMFEDTGAGYKLFSMDMVVVDSVTVPQNGSFEEWTIREGFSYPWGGSGRCGSLVLSPTLASPIIGIHTAGSEGIKGFAERLLRETFEETPSLIEYVEPQLDVQGSVYQLDGSYTEVGKLERDLVPNFPKESAIVPSIVAPVFPITTEPAPLSNQDERLEEECDILKIGASKRCDPMKEFPELLVNLARSHYEDKIVAQVKPLRGNIGMLSYAQAIEGLPSDSTGPIVMSTSEGFPWRSLRPKSEKNKRWLFQFDNSSTGLKVSGIERSLYENLNYKHELRKQGKVPASYFTCCLKDARILREKVSIPGKTRIFEMSPIELTIAQRQYFYDYVGAYIASRVEHAIGINPDGPEWSVLANSLNEFSPYILTADYSAYGPRVNSALLYEAYGVTTAWYRYHMAQQGRQDEDLYRVQQVVAHEVAHGLHVVNNLVFRPSAGLPSGNIETVTKNSQVNSLYVRIAFLGLASDNAPHYSDLYWFEKFVLLYTYGDDLIMAVKEEILSWFNNQTLIEFFSRYRLKMTDALKSGSTRPYCSLNEATFLKRGFLPHPTRVGHWLAPLERASITDTANWIHKSINPLEASLVNSEMCCRLAYTLGPDDFDTICQTVKEKWRQRGHRFEFPSWHSLDCHVWDGTPGPLFSF